MSTASGTTSSLGDYRDPITVDVCGDWIAFSTGKRLNAINGVIGINSACNEVTQGYKSDIRPNGDQPATELTEEEKIALADHMIERWQKFRELHLQKLAGRKEGLANENP